MLTLTPREIDAICFVAHGLTDSEIAEKMHIKPTSVRSHLGRARHKLGFPLRTRGGTYDTIDKANRVKLAIYALQQGYIALKDIPAIGGNQ